ncbi:Putative DNA-binding domain-containing protein [Flagellimonas taeanensis]|uniref:DNA-binding domain-containing protein n=1 Tax=Flagellimonas taeanensis TaxID=1005926 RepID=A0A1M6SHY5_9FLAO|nr:ATP-binding protein [Allomuricauda taeanensis]SFB80933.1 Putative DNA-binding domain-containing protein [Allomuricauda taeanensis]SHK44404.1 Putative DNA-binding domain-containing protein [Allomuricauda taeanensis]
MYILGIRADKIREADIKRLLEHQIQESSGLDYKKEFSISRDKDKKEFLFDVSAMYNTDGGCLIYGIEEEKDADGQNTGRPHEITGIEIQNSDKLTQQIEDVVKNCTEPSINQLLINELQIDGKTILILGIPKGLGLPAMVTFNQTNKFYKRRNSGKFAVDVYELNNMFMQNQVLKEKAGSFRKERINAVLNRESIPNLEIDHSFFIHIIPYGFLEYQIVDFSIVEKERLLDMRPLYSHGSDQMYNIDGYATFTTSSDRQKISSYNQIFRNGVYEVYTSEMFFENRKGNNAFDGRSMIKETLDSIDRGLKVLNDLEVGPPFLVSFSFHNVLGNYLENDRSTYNRAFKQNELIFPMILVPTYESEIYSLLKPNFDILWQSFGFAKSTEIKE